MKQLKIFHVEAYDGYMLDVKIDYPQNSKSIVVFCQGMLMRMDTANLDFLASIPAYFVYSGVLVGGFIILVLSSMLSIKIYNETDLA